MARGNCYVHVLLPAVLPATMPISASPPRLAERLDLLRGTAERALREPMRRGRIEVIPARSVQSAIGWAIERGMPDEIALAGSAPWRLRGGGLRHVAPFRVVRRRIDTTRQTAAGPISGYANSAAASVSPSHAV